MSSITDVILYVFNMDEELHEAINQPVDPTDMRAQRLSRIDMENAGGTKRFVEEVWAAALNHVPAVVVKEWFLNLPINNDQRAILIVNHENDLDADRPPMMLCR